MGVCQGCGRGSAIYTGGKRAREEPEEQLRRGDGSEGEENEEKGEYDSDEAMDVVEFDEVPGDEDASKPDVAPPEFDDLLEGVATTEPKDLTADRASRPRTLLKMTACLRLRRPYVDDAEKATADEEPFEFEEDSEENEARELDKSVEELCNDSGGEGGASEMSQPTEKVIKCPSKWRSPEGLGPPGRGAQSGLAANGVLRRAQSSRTSSLNKMQRSRSRQATPLQSLRIYRGRRGERSVGRPDRGSGSPSSTRRSV